MLKLISRCPDLKLTNFLLSLEVFYRLLCVAFWSGWRCSSDELWRKCCNNRNPDLHLCSCRAVAVLFPFMLFMTQRLKVETMVCAMSLVNWLLRWITVHLCRNSGKVILMFFFARTEGKPFRTVALPKCYCFRYFLSEVGQWYHSWGKDLRPCSWKRWFCNSVECITLGYFCFIRWAVLLLEESSAININLLPLQYAVLRVSVPLLAALSPLGGNSSFWLAGAQSSSYAGQKWFSSLQTKMLTASFGQTEHLALLNSLVLFKLSVCFGVELLAWNSSACERSCGSSGAFRCVRAVFRHCSTPASILTSCQSKNQKAQHSTDVVLHNMRS